MIIEVKLSTILLSFLFFINQTQAVGLPTEYRLAVEKKFLEVASEWNSSSTYADLIARFPATSLEKKRLKKLAREAGLLQQKPARVEYMAKYNQFKLDQKSNTTIWFFAIAPTLIIYDGERIIDVKPKESLSKVLDQWLLKPSPSNKVTPKRSKTVLLWQLWNPESQAQLVTPEQQAELDAKRAKVAEHQTSVAKTILWTAVLTFGGFLGGAWLWNNYAHLLNPEWGNVGRAKVQDDLVMAKNNFPEVEKTLFGPKDNLSDLTCESNDSSSRLTYVSFGTESTKKEFHFEKETQTIESIAKDDPFRKKIEQAEYCCQHYPCLNWISSVMTGSRPDFENTKDNDKSSSDSSKGTNQ